MGLVARAALCAHVAAVLGAPRVGRVGGHMAALLAPRTHAQLRQVVVAEVVLAVPVALLVVGGVGRRDALRVLLGAKRARLHLVRARARARARVRARARARARVRARARARARAHRGIVPAEAAAVDVRPPALVDLGALLPLRLLLLALLRVLLAPG